MLDNSEKQKVEEYIDRIINGIKMDIDKKNKDGFTDKEIIESVIRVTVNKLTPESKMILSSIYNMQKEHTLSAKYYSDTDKKAFFYEMDILKDINKKFNFEIPQNIDYRNSGIEFNTLVKSGAIVIVGGVISITLNSLIPVGVAIILGGIMGLLLKDKKKLEYNAMDKVIDEYLINVKQSLLLWVNSIEIYYDERVSQLERESVI